MREAALRGGSPVFWRTVVRALSRQPAPGVELR